MRPFFTLILTAALCFVAGYTIGKKHKPYPIAPAIEQAAAVPVSEPAPIPAPIPETRQPTAPEVIPQKPTEPERFAARALQAEITLTDSIARSLVCELLTATEKHLKVRRKSDNRIVEVPVTMLSQEDQAFAAYLYKVEQEKQLPASISDADKIWDELLKGM
ncbi:hypothetical protein SH580_06865 [Coraliomargarita algicola]|uniref:Uncharacterized protein n=1 Tax=Coraliomargarita algicola TaxID=3092156 RepID=A0ABZ0RRL3_9BACT|nr:hypothetical protein [Coraliomargarita sp. J2-16]WPJ97430.1 hypothetical protein SH580_06865 [Coraliomargarita sp. J2-16]